MFLSNSLKLQPVPEAGTTGYINEVMMRDCIVQMQHLAPCFFYIFTLWSLIVICVFCDLWLHLRRVCLSAMEEGSLLCGFYWGFLHFSPVRSFIVWCSFASLWLRVSGQKVSYSVLTAKPTAALWFVTLGCLNKRDLTWFDFVNGEHLPFKTAVNPLFKVTVLGTFYSNLAPMIRDVFNAS